ncbi:hypothetical protein KKA02_04555, partial [Patescibacteria group bacterium]|nr:hypothetical protein [Patescibacteria group bacterium]
MPSKFTKAIFLQFSGMVGAGIFSLPFVYSQSSFNLSILGLIFLTLITAFINLLYIDIINATPGDHQLPGYAQIYLGSFFKNISILNISLTSLGATYAFTTLASGFLTVLFPYLSVYLATAIFLIFLFLIHINNNKFSNKLSDIIPILFLFLPVFFFSFIFQNRLPSIVINNPSLVFFGPTIFALSGFTILPEVEEILRGQKNYKKLFKKASLIGLFLASFLYLLFSYSILKISGPFLTQNLVDGLVQVSPFLSKILAIFGLCVTFSASLIFLNIFKEVFYRDLNIKQNLARFLPILIPIIAITIIKTSFISVISLIGSLSVFLSAIIISLIRLKLPHKNFHKLQILVILTTFL